MWRGFGQQVAPEPPAPPADFADRASADFQSTAYTELGTVSRMLSTGDAYQESIDRVYGITGRKVENPAYLVDGVAIGNARKALDEAWGQAQQQDSTLGPMPDPHQRAVEIAQQKATRSLEMAPASVGFGGVGGFLGATAATMLHPIQLAMLPFGGAAKTGGWAANILREGVEQALIGAATQVPIEIEAAPWRQRVGIEQSSLSNIAQAGLGGFALGAGFRAVGEGVRALRGRGSSPGYTGQSWYPVVEQAAREAGVSPEYMAKTAMIEGSGANVRPKGPGQTASGLFGFTDGTWKQSGGDLADKADIAAQADVMARFTAANRDALRRRLGREPTDLELYAAHHFDPAISARMAEAPDSTPMIDLVGQRAVDANPYLNGMTVGGWKERYARKFGDEYAPRGRPAPQDEQDMLRTVDRAARDVDDAHGAPEAATAHMENMRAAERGIVDGETPQITPLPESPPPVRRLAAPSGREAEVQHELVELSALWGDEPTGKTDRPVIGPDNKVEAGGDAVDALRGGDAQAQARQFEMARELGLDPAGYVQPVVVDRRVGHMAEAERAQWVRDWREPPAPASEMARGLSGPDRADLAVAEAIARRAEEQGVSIGDVIAGGEAVPPGAMRFLRAMTQDDAMRVRADSADVLTRVKAAATRQAADPTLRSGAAPSPPPVERAIRAVTEQTEQALKPEAVKSTEMKARRDIADALTSRPDIGEQRVETGDGREIALEDVDAELRRLERMDEAADVIDAACLGLRALKVAAE